MNADLRITKVPGVGPAAEKPSCLVDGTAAARPKFDRQIKLARGQQAPSSNTNRDRTPQFSVVIPCYNEAEVLPLLRAKLLPCLEHLGVSWEAVFVDDGSQDSTFEQLAHIHREEPRVRVVALSRNFGHQEAILAGLMYACGEAVGIMDADLQDPPEMLGAGLSKLQDGYDVVYMVRRNRKEHLLKRAAYRLFYDALKRVAEPDIPVDSGDFCVMTRRVADVLRHMPERNLFVRGMRAWAGFRQVGLEYDRQRRAAGRTKYPFCRLAGLAGNGFFSFSTLPLRVALYLGLATLLLSVGMGLLTLLWWVCGFTLMGYNTTSEIPASAVLAGGMVFFGGVQLLILGCLGEYVARIYSEIKQRPRWIVSETLGFDPLRV